MANLGQNKRKDCSQMTPRETIKFYYYYEILGEKQSVHGYKLPKITENG